MKLIARVKLNPTPQQEHLLHETLKAGNTLCNRISQLAFEQQLFRRYAIHNSLYKAIRLETRLTSQFVIRCIAKVADSYQINQETGHTFKPLGAIAYDDRILSWETDNRKVSIWTIQGRQRIAYSVTDYHASLLQYRQGETDLVFYKRHFFLLAVCEIPEPKEQDVEAALGIDLGQINIATTSDGDIASSEAIEHKRMKHQRLRTQLQKKGTRSAKRHLKKLSGKQRRYQRDVNHVLSKRLVTEAQRTNRLLALEDLTGIKARTRVKGKEARAKRSNWSFAQLRTFLEYKARRVGVEVRLVDPAYTSQRCFACGHIEKANRKSQSEFLCCVCGHADHADKNAALNIAWAAFNQPLVTGVLGENPASVASLIPCG